jgi:hypothetical protein
MEDDSNMRHYAQLAEGSYGSKDLSHLGYEIDNELSNKNRTLYYNKDTNKVVYSLRGTNPKNIHDLTTDALLAVGLKDISSRFRNANKYTKKAIEKYGKDNLSLAGHSLGASQSLYVNSKHNIEAHAFNPYIEPTVKKSNLLNKAMYALFKKPVNSNAYIYRTTTDPVSIFSSLSNANVKTIQPKSKNPHKLKGNFF